MSLPFHHHKSGGRNSLLLRNLCLQLCHLHTPLASLPSRRMNDEMVENVATGNHKEDCLRVKKFVTAVKRKLSSIAIAINGYCMIFIFQRDSYSFRNSSLFSFLSFLSSLEELVAGQLRSMISHDIQSDERDEVMISSEMRMNWKSLWN